MLKPQGRRGQSPEVVVIGAASRDLAADDHRGWRLGGGVAYSALTAARLGLRTAALIGVDQAAAAAGELDILREAGVDVVIAPLGRGPVFENTETPAGRVQTCLELSDLLPIAALPVAWGSAPAWILSPVAAELANEWAAVMPIGSQVAVGWQGLLRRLEPGRPVRRKRPVISPLLRRADLVGVSRDDVDSDATLSQLGRCLRPGATLVLTLGRGGGLLMDFVASGAANRVANGVANGVASLRRYPAVPSRQPIDPTGAGDSFLAALFAARVQPRLIGGRLGRGRDLLVAAAVASLVIEGVGLRGVPERSAVRARMAAGLAPIPTRP